MSADDRVIGSLPPTTALLARAQAVREGEARDVCFGLFDRHDGEYGEALQRLAERIVSQLTDGGPRVLLFGLGLGSLFQSAMRRNVNVSGTCEDPALHAAVAHRCGSERLLPPSGWNALQLPDGGYDAIVLHEVLSYSDSLVIFGKSYRALADGGSLLLVGEFASGEHDSRYDGLPRLRYFPTLAERCGFALEAQDDLSERAFPTLEYFDRLLADCGRQLMAELDLDAHELARIREENRRRRLAYLEGSRAFLLLRFRKRAGLRWRVSHVDTRDFAAVADLFRRIFQQEMSPALWCWKYGGGRGQGSIAWAGDKVVAHYGGLTRSVLFFGRPERACQVADVMVDPAERGVLTRKGPFFLTAASLAEACSGFGANHLIGFGFPNARAMRVGVRQGLYADAGRVVEVFWAPTSSRSSPLTRMDRITDAGMPDLEQIAEPLWCAMSGNLQDAIVGVRDSNWLRYRYLSHPQHDYFVLHLHRRFPRKSHGIIVLKRDGQRCELLDVVAPLANLAWLIREARRIASRWRSNELYGWFAEHYAPLFAGADGQIRNIDVTIPSGIWTDGPGPDQLRNAWWLTAGDTDFH